MEIEIGTGIFGFPIERCAEIMLSNTVAYLKGETELETVVFCLYGRDAYGIFAKTLKGMLSL